MEKNKPTKNQEYRDPDIVNSEKAILRAAKAAQDKARRFGHGVIIWEDGKIVEWLPEKEFPPLTESANEP